MKCNIWLAGGSPCVWGNCVCYMSVPATTCFCLITERLNRCLQDYEAFWESFGRYVKLGCIEDAVRLLF